MGHCMRDLGIVVVNRLAVRVGVMGAGLVNLHIVVGVVVDEGSGSGGGGRGGHGWWLWESGVDGGTRIANGQISHGQQRSLLAS